MEIGLLQLLKILGSLALFIFGMKYMSEGVQRAASSQMRIITRRMTSNRFVGLLSGLLITALVQSSSATTVMTVSFVNAGLISLVESAGIIMGANIGTTITGWLVNLGIGNFSLADYSLPIIVIGLPLLFINRGRSKYWGEFLIGFALLFLGLDFLKSTFPSFNENPEALRFLADYAQLGFLSTLLFVFIGAIITAAIQSSSAAMALTLILLAKGWVSLDVAAAMILGENIGTTITAEIAALVGNVHAKRSARVHSLFNILGVAWMVFLLPWFLNGVKAIVENFIMPALPFASLEVTTIAAFHTSFNLVNALLLIGFIPWIIQLAKKTIKTGKDQDNNFRLTYIDSLLKTPELSIIEAQKEMLKFGKIAARMNGFTRSLMLSTDQKEQQELLDRIAKYEKITDRMESELANYLDRISSDEISFKTSVKIRSILGMCNDLEHIGDIFYQMSKTLERKVEEKIWFNQHQRDQLQNMFDKVDQAFKVLIENLSSPHYKNVSLDLASKAEDQINSLRNQLRQEALESQKSQEYNINSIIVYNNLFSSLEKIGDHIFNVSEAITVNN